MNKQVSPSSSLFVAIALSMWTGGAIAQDKSVSLDAVIVIGDKVQLEAIAKPLTVIDAEELSRRQSSTLGETLTGLPGVSATSFGPNASRPILRGQDGDRVKILQNSAPLSDASAMSFDHAVGLNPYALEQVEILRGPAALLYGGSAVGGVVNLVDRRILRNRLDGPSRSIDLRAGSSNNNRQGSFELESSLGRDLFFHIDGFAQKNGETRTPLFTDNGDTPVTGRRVRNSAAESSSLGAGISKIDGGGFLGFSLETDQSDYGVPKNTSTTIDMNRSRLAFAADQTLSNAVWDRIRIRTGLTDYQHKERDSGVVSSTFKNQANDFRMELSHRAIGGWKGLVGLQWEYSDLDVISPDEDPLLPRTKSPKLGLFLLEEQRLGSGTVRLGARIEHAQVKSSRSFTVNSYGADGGPAGDIDTNGAAQNKSFLPLSLSAEYSHPLAAMTNLGISLSHVQRAPSNYELFATGVHHASGLFEVGNPALGKENGNHLDITFSHAPGVERFKASAFYSRYSNYLTLIKRGSGDTEFFHEHTPGVIEGVPVYDYSGVGAKFYGLELEYSTAYKLGAFKLAPKIVYDYVIGKRTSNDAYIPRLTPQRLTPSVDVTTGRWLLRGELKLVDKARLGENETVQAAGYALVNVLVEHRVGNQIWFLKGTNLTDRLAYNATTADEVRQFTPLAGRALQAGLRLYF